MDSLKYPKLRVGITLVARLSRRLWREDEGQDLVEYGLLILLVGLAAIAAMQNLASGISGMFASVATSLTSGS